MLKLFLTTASTTPPPPNTAGLGMLSQCLRVDKQAIGCPACSARTVKSAFQCTLPGADPHPIPTGKRFKASHWTNA